MSKMAIEWHEQCLRSMRKSLDNKREEIAMLERYYRRLEEDCRFLDDQIQSAKVTKKGGFDADRYKRKIPVKR